MGNLTKIKAVDTDEGLVIRSKHTHKKGKKGRKRGRNFRYDGTTHSQTKYRANGNREKNKARRAKQRERRLQILKDKHNGISTKHTRSEDSDRQPEGTGSSQR